MTRPTISSRVTTSISRCDSAGKFVVEDACCDLASAPLTSISSAMQLQHSLELQGSFNEERQFVHGDADREPETLALTAAIFVVGAVDGPQGCLVGGDRAYRPRRGTGATRRGRRARALTASTLPPTDAGERRSPCCGQCLLNPGFSQGCARGRRCRRWREAV